MESILSCLVLTAFYESAHAFAEQTFAEHLKAVRLDHMLHARYGGVQKE
jgi:hypothetical protein